MKKILFISVALIMALSIGLIGCDGGGGGGGGGPQPSPKIVIGMSRSLHGSLAIVHISAFGGIYPTYIAAANVGGVPVGNTTFQIDTRVLDDNSDPAVLSANTATLISEVDDGDVHTIFGPTCTYFIDVMAPLCNTAGCVMMGAEGGGSFLITYPGPPPLPGPINDMPYVFLHLSFSDWYQLPVLACALDEAHYAYCGQHNATAWIVWQDDAHGLEYLYNSWKYFPAANITIVGNTSVLNSPSYSYGTKLAQIAAANPDILCLFCYPGEIFGFVGTAIGTATNFKAVVGGPGACFGNFNDATGLGGYAEGIMTFAVANNQTSNNATPIANATMTMENLFNNVIGGGNFSLQDPWGHPLYWAAMEIWQNAIEAVGYVQGGGFMVSQTALKNELASYNNALNGVNTVLGRTWYHMFTPNGGGILDWACHTGGVGQWQDGYIEVIAPNQIIAPNMTKVSLTSVQPRYTATTNTTRYPKATWP